MSDFYFNADISRDAVAEQLGSNYEQTPYVLAEVADYLEPDTNAFEDFAYGLRSLTGEQRVNLHSFCLAVAHELNEAVE